MKLHSKIIGSGKPFVILHGFLGMGDNWKTLGNKFASWGFEVHLVDQRNHGRSPHSNDFSYEWMAEDLLLYCAEHHFDQITLLGHSMGGKTAMCFATKYPDKVSQLMIADIAPRYYASHHQDILEGLLAMDFSEIMTRAAGDSALASYVPDSGTRMFLLKNLYWETKEKLGLRLNIEVLSQKVVEIGVMLPAEATFDGATLFLKGAKSNYISDDDETDIRRHFPNANIVEIPNAGHWLHAENPSFFADKIYKFVNSLS